MATFTHPEPSIPISKREAATRDAAEFYARKRLEHRRGGDSHLAHRRRDSRTRNEAWHRARGGWAPRSITGNIDFLQVRNDAMHILGYQPDARTNKPIAQPAIYVLALTMRVPALKLFDIKCAWFSKVFPRTLFATR
jgi:hypothetical protein